LGMNAEVNNDSSIVVGTAASEGGVSDSGSGAVVVSASGGAADSAVAIGQSATADGSQSICIGNGTFTGSTDTGAVVIGNSASAQSPNVIALGESTGVENVTASNGATVVIGQGAEANGADGAVLIRPGQPGTTEVINTSGLARISTDQLAFGGVRDTVADADLKNSELVVELDEANSSFRLRGKDSTGTIREATIAW